WQPVAVLRLGHLNPRTRPSRVVMLAAVLPPLDSLAAQCFAAHMLQHELLMIVGVPLVVTGRPMATCLWALPAVLRRDAARMFQRDTPIGVLWRLVTAPGAAWILHSVVSWVLHRPALYELALI